VVGAVIAPVLAAIGALAALLTDRTIGVERTANPPVLEEMVVGAPVTNGMVVEEETTAI
jgi:hypothetical protein